MDDTVSPVTSTPVRDQPPQPREGDIPDDSVIQVTAIAAESAKEENVELEKEEIQLALVEELKNGRPELRPINNKDATNSTHFGRVEMIY